MGLNSFLKAVLGLTEVVVSAAFASEFVNNARCFAFFFIQTATVDLVCCTTAALLC